MFYETDYGYKRNGHNAVFVKLGNAIRGLVHDLNNFYDELMYIYGYSVHYTS